MSDFVLEYLASIGDSRKVLVDPQARYFSTLVDDRALVPLDIAKPGTLDFRTWHAQRSQAAA